MLVLVQLHQLLATRSNNTSTVIIMMSFLWCQAQTLLMHSQVCGRHLLPVSKGSSMALPKPRCDSLSKRPAALTGAKRSTATNQARMSDDCAVLLAQVVQSLLPFIAVGSYINIILDPGGCASLCGHCAWHHSTRVHLAPYQGQWRATCPRPRANCHTHATTLAASCMHLTSVRSHSGACNHRRALCSFAGLAWSFDAGSPRPW